MRAEKPPVVLIGRFRGNKSHISKIFRGFREGANTESPQKEFLRGKISFTEFQYLSSRGEVKRGSASLIKLNPLPLIKGKGIKGIGLPKIKGEVE